VSEPWLSVIMPTCDGAAYLTATLASIARQHDDRIEIIAVDDGSSDATLAILQDHAGRLPLRIIPRRRVGNWVANTNFGLARAHGRFVCFLHQDDLWLPDRLQTLRQQVEREPQVALHLAASRYIDSTGRWLGTWRSPLPPGRQAAGTVVERLLIQNFIAVPAPICTREAALAVGGLDETLWYTADWDFWLKLAARSPTVYCPRPLSAFRVHSQSQTAQGVARAGEMRRQIEVVLEKHLAAWEAAHPGRREVGQAARMSMDVNFALASCAYGDRPHWLALAGQLALLGPSGWYRFFRDSRILERVAAQVKARMARSDRGTVLPWRARKPLAA
jgi:hypothetical protein